MVVAEEANPGHHTAHAGGVAAILQIENNPLELVQAVLSGHPLVLNGKKVGFSVYLLYCDLMSRRIMSRLHVAQAVLIRVYIICLLN